MKELPFSVSSNHHTASPKPSTRLFRKSWIMVVAKSNSSCSSLTRINPYVRNAAGLPWVGVGSYVQKIRTENGWSGAHGLSHKHKQPGGKAMRR